MRTGDILRIDIEALGILQDIEVTLFKALGIYPAAREGLGNLNGQPDAQGLNERLVGIRFAIRLCVSCVAWAGVRVDASANMFKFYFRIFSYWNNV